MFDRVLLSSLFTARLAIAFVALAAVLAQFVQPRIALADDSTQASQQFVHGNDLAADAASIAPFPSNGASSTVAWPGTFRATDDAGWELDDMKFVLGTVPGPAGYEILGGLAMTASVAKPIVLVFDLYDINHAFLGAFEITLPVMPPQALDLAISLPPSEQSAYQKAAYVSRHVLPRPASQTFPGFVLLTAPGSRFLGTQRHFVVPTGPLTAPPVAVQRAATSIPQRCYQVTFKRFQIVAIHSPNSDTDFAAMHVDLNDQMVHGGTPTINNDGRGFLAKRLGNIGNGTYDVDLQSAKVCMSASDRLRINYEVLNHGNPSAATTAAIQAQNPLYMPDAPVSDDGSSIASKIVTLVGMLQGKSGCDDIMAGEILEYTGADLFKWFHSPQQLTEVPDWFLTEFGPFAKIRARKFTDPGGGGVPIIGLGACQNSDYRTWLVIREFN